MFLAHERLDAYRLALDTARWAAAHAIPPHRKHLRDQLVRAADSVVLAIAEGSGLSGDARRHHYRIALGSARARSPLTIICWTSSHLATTARCASVSCASRRCSRRWRSADAAIGGRRHSRPSTRGTGAT